MDNRSAEESGWDDGLLVAELDELLAMDFDLACAGFEEDLGELLASGDALGLTGHGADDGDELPAAAELPVSRPGDLWVCGPHRVLCGNATMDDDVSRLLGSDVAAMCLTDPPFNVAIDKDSNPKHRQRRGLVNDDLPETDAFVLGRSKYHRRYEPIWYGWRASATSSYSFTQMMVAEWCRPAARMAPSSAGTTPRRP